MAFDGVQKSVPVTEMHKSLVFSILLHLLQTLASWFSLLQQLVQNLG